MKIKKWCADAAALLCVLQVAPVRAEAESHYRFLFQKGLALTETLRKMAASEGYLSLCAPASPGLMELAERVATVAFGEPDTAAVIVVPEESLELALKVSIAPLMRENPSIDYSLFEDTTVREMFMAQLPNTIADAWVARRGIDWVMLSNAITISGMDDLPEGLSNHTYMALAYHEEQVVCLVSFSPSERWQFVSYFAKLIPYDSNLGTEPIQEIINTMLPGWGKLFSSNLQITTFTNKEVSDLLFE